MNEKRFLEIVKSLLNDNTGISLATELENIEEWDSLTRIKFMLMLSQEYGVSLPRFDVAEAETIGDLYELVKENS